MKVIPGNNNDMSKFVHHGMKTINDRSCLLLNLIQVYEQRVHQTVSYNCAGSWNIQAVGTIPCNAAQQDGILI